jgi:hypothetical protein
MSRSLRRRTPTGARRASSASIVALVGALLVSLAASTATAATPPHLTGASSMSIYLTGVAAVPGGTGAWAVGFANSSSPPYDDAPVMWKWSGSKWATEPIPSLGKDGSLTAVAATSASNAWALGLSGPSSSTADPVLLHWNGVAWTIVKFPSSDDTDYFEYMAASGAGVFVAGGTNGSTSHPLLLGYMKARWTAEKLPALPLNTDLGALSATSASPSGLWATAISCVSSLCTSSVLKPDKSGWSLVSVAGKGASLTGLAALSSTHVLVVGEAGAKAGTFGKLLIERSKGSSWTAMKAASSIATGTLSSADLSSPIRGWAAGDTETDTATAVLVDRLEGSTWSATKVKIPGKNGLLIAFSAESASSAWLFARSYTGKVCLSPSTIVAERWSGSSWSVVKTPPLTLGAAVPLTVPAIEPHC